MIVSISEAARMVGIKSRSTMYRHIKKKNITVLEDDDGNPRIDVSELVRVYGSKVKMKENGTNETPQIKQPVQTNTGTTNIVELEVLKERLKNLESIRENQEDQIENLRKTVEEAHGQSKRLTTLITDQSGSQQQKEADRDNKIEALENIVKDMKAQNDDLLAKEKLRQERQAERRFQRESVERAEKARLAEEANKTFWQKLFG